MTCSTSLSLSLIHICGQGQASQDGEGQDEFVFQISKDEYLDLLFEDFHRIGDFVHVRITEASSATLKGEEVF